jgi:hypothetical protein
MKKILKDIKELRWKKPKPDVEAAKIRLLVFDTGVSGFPRINRV